MVREEAHDLRQAGDTLLGGEDAEVDVRLAEEILQRVLMLAEVSANFSRLPFDSQMDLR